MKEYNTEILRPREIPNLGEIKVYTPLRKIELKNLLENHVWVTAGREKLYVREMESSHIRNCIRCWNGEGYLRIPTDYLGGKDKWLKIFHDELINRQ